MKVGVTIKTYLNVTQDDIDLVQAMFDEEPADEILCQALEQGQEIDIYVEEV